MVKQWVWPRDKKKRSFGSGLLDIMTGKGPDMYVADARSPKIDWTEWGRWPQHGPQSPNGPAGFPGYYHYDDDWRTPPWIRSKRGYKSYDPRTRKYKTQYPHPDLGVWPPSYGPPPHQGLHGGHGQFGQFGQGAFGGAGQHGDEWRWARQRRQSIPRSAGERLHDWRRVRPPAVLAVGGGMNSRNVIWGPKAPPPWYAGMTTTASSIPSLSSDDIWSDY
ncbi:MAG: hypothetical protein M1816_000957 [Peltula sp. TS41687]|nr:MAG: hypothetical protein M1816_000957 [Peltula sp. TS41687]